MLHNETIFKSDSEKLLILVFIVVVSLMTPGCTFNGGLKSFNDMTHKEKATWMLSIYNAQYADYMERAKKPQLTETERQVLRTKKKILSQVYPMIKMYVAYIETGTLPEKEVEENIFLLIDKIVKM